jgi:proteasome activator subunit 4
MTELNDNPELQLYSSAVLYALSAVTPPQDYVEVILGNFVAEIKSSAVRKYQSRSQLQLTLLFIILSQSWRIRLQALPALVVFFYRNLLTISPAGVSNVMDVLLECLGDENVEVREMASKSLSGIVRCSQRLTIIPLKVGVSSHTLLYSLISLKNRFVNLARKTQLPRRKEANYPESLRTLHSAILGICALIESFPYSVERWMPSLTEG